MHWVNTHTHANDDGDDDDDNKYTARRNNIEARHMIAYKQAMHAKKKKYGDGDGDDDWRKAGDLKEKYRISTPYRVMVRLEMWWAYLLHDSAYISMTESVNVSHQWIGRMCVCVRNAYLKCSENKNPHTHAHIWENET